MKNNLNQPRLSDTASNDMSLVAESLLGLTELSIKVRYVVAAKVLEFHPFQIVPDAFVGVQLRGVCRELLQVNTTRRPLARKFLATLLR